MIKSLGCDVEIFVNLFSVTFVDLQDYMKTFSDLNKIINGNSNVNIYLTSIQILQFKFD